MRCNQCGDRIVTSERQGRVARFCSSACRQRAYRQRRRPLPVELTSRPRWVCWELRERRGNTAKVPLTIFGSAASVTDPRTWSTYEKARAGTDQVGIVLGDGLGCIDLDHCVTDGVVAPWARGVIAQHRADAHLVELSPSGTGVHIFLPMGEAPGRKIRDGEVQMEIYSRARFMTVTGHRI